MLSHTEMPTSLQGAEEAIKKHEDFLTTTEASEEKITGVVESGRRLISDCNANSDKIQEKVDSIQERSEQVNYGRKCITCKHCCMWRMTRLSYLFSVGIVKIRRQQTSYLPNSRTTVSFSTSYKMDRR